MLLDGITRSLLTVPIVSSYMNKAIERASLQTIAGPFFFVMGSHEEAFTIIAESHISVKWFPTKLVLVDLFSCKLFYVEDMATFTVQELGLERWKVLTLERAGLGDRDGRSLL